MLKERFQNGVIGDNITLRLLAYNSNNRANFDSVTKVDVYFLDPALVSESNPDGRRLIESITDVNLDDVGAYSTVITIASELYVIGKYIDVWSVVLGGDTIEITNNFEIYPNLWFTTTTPISYDYEFAVRPNRLRKGSKRYLQIEITPNVPNRDQLVQYYENLAIVSPLKIYIEQKCGDCLPEESDLRTVVDGDDVVLREKCTGFYFIDTSEMEQGIYDVWFELEMGENVYISEKQQIQII